MPKQSIERALTSYVMMNAFISPQEHTKHLEYASASSGAFFHYLPVRTVSGGEKLKWPRRCMQGT